MCKIIRFIKRIALKILWMNKLLRFTFFVYFIKYSILNDMMEPKDRITFILFSCETKLYNDLNYSIIENKSKLKI